MITVRNIYHMLSYAYRTLQTQGYTSCGTEEFENTADLLSAILHLGVNLQIKRGLGRSYIEHTSPLSRLSGKIEVTDSIRQQSLIRQQLVCTYDDFSVDTRLNRILKGTMELLLKADIPLKRKKDLRRALLYFGDIQTVDVTTVDWNFNFNRNNQSYYMLMAICQMVVEGLLLRNEPNAKDNPKFRDFFDDQQMCRLYEKFLLEFYCRHYPQLNPRSAQVAWVEDDGNTILLPTMQTDVTLSYGEHTLIIDAKYYQSVLTHHYGTPKLRSDHLYQILAYVKNKAVEGGEISGLILYAKPDNSPDVNIKYLMQGNHIGALTLDLNREFTEISAQLEGIAREYFGVEKQS